MTSTPQKQLEHFLQRFTDKEIAKEYLDLYDDQPKYQYVLAWLHEQYNEAFDFMTYKAPHGEGGHFNADASRDLISANEKYSTLMRMADNAGVKIQIIPEYARVIKSSGDWLMPTEGSTIPEGLTPITLEKYDSIFEIEDNAITLTGTGNAPLQFIGEGAYAIVHKFINPNYGIPFARKKLRKTVDEEERQRFHREYELMKRFDFPYILKVYQYDDSNNSYTMEYCEYSLKNFISHNNTKLSYGIRRKIAMQFLYGMNFLHNNGVYHRDLSYKNILVHTYRDSDAFAVKLSDFGLAKERNSDLTSTGSSMKGSIIDPALESFKDFSAVNDIYAIGFILSYIFIGRESLFINQSPLSSIIQKCSSNDPESRYNTVKEIIAAIRTLPDASDPRQETKNSMTVRDQSPTCQ